MNPVKLLASRNILIGVAIIGILFVSFVLLQTRTGSSETMPSAERIGQPPVADGDVVPLDTFLAAFNRSRTTALRRFRSSPLSAPVDGVTTVGKNGWAASVTLGGKRATAYFSDSQWQSIHPPVAAGQLRTFTCADWQSGASGTVMMYGCGIVDAH